MKKIKSILTLLVVFSLSLNLDAQSDSERISQLETQLKNRDKKDYDSISKTIHHASENYPILIKDFEILETKSDFTDLFAKLTTAANPNNEELLGKSYTSFIKEEAKNILLKDLKDEAKSGFLSILTKITSIPIVNAVINSNPVGAIVSQVINSASNFVSQKIDGCNLCEKTLKYTESIQQNRINEFSKKIQPFVDYYDKILIADRAISQNLEVYKVILKENRNQASVKNIQLGSLIVDPTRPWTSRSVLLNNLLNVNDGNYRQSIDNDKVQKLYAVAKTYKLYESNYLRYNQEFSKMFSIYLDAYYKALNELKSYALLNNYTTNKIEELQLLIKTFINKYATANVGSEISNPSTNKTKSIRLF
ncbi:hypothetical protein [Chryseobacterium sp. Leaf394]|uniref:hypothetical protein n=1 Tax=Chryseobacterium sp. Leaf394 TaxID=1736361 RepID=UPI0006FCA87F|nr:hypothetical protein [Chryseobacterium sp. Leaf394]KQS91717.1 hypothetical protein ASG21_04445 [Chryseobacterium sp. Leaf394]